MSSHRDFIALSLLVVVSILVTIPDSVKTNFPTVAGISSTIPRQEETTRKPESNPYQIQPLLENHLHDGLRVRTLEGICIPRDRFFRIDQYILFRQSNHTPFTPRILFVRYLPRDPPSA